MKFKTNALEEIRNKEDITNLFNTWNLIVRNDDIQVQKVVYYFYLLAKKYKETPIEVRTSVGFSVQRKTTTKHLILSTKMFTLDISDAQTHLSICSSERFPYVQPNGYFYKGCVLAGGYSFLKSLKKMRACFILYDCHKKGRIKLSSSFMKNSAFEKWFNKFAKGKMTKKKFRNVLSLII